MRYRVIFVVYMCLLMSGLAAEQWKVFNNEELGYSVSYPANFSAQYQDSQFSALLSDGSSMSPVTLTFTSDLLNPEDLGKGIDQTLEQFLADLRTEVETYGFELLELEQNKKVKFQGMDATTILLNVDMMMWQMKMTAIVFTRGGRNYMLMMGAVHEQFDDMLATFEQFKDSLTFK